MDYTTPPHSRGPTELHTHDPSLAPIQTGSSSHYEKTAYTAATPVTMRGDYGEAASILGMSSPNIGSPSLGGPTHTHMHGHGHGYGHGHGEAGGGGAIEEKAAEAHSRAHGGSTPNFDFGAAISSLGGGDEKKRMLSQPPAVGAGAVGRSLALKVGKGVKRGDLPFMLVFIA